MSLISRQIDHYYRSRIARRLECRPGEILLRTVFLKRLKGIYYCNPKAAGSTIIATLIRADAGFDSQVSENHNTTEARNQISAEQDLRMFLKAMDDRHFFRFTFVRNPYVRVLSCFIDKFADGPQRQRFRREIGLPEDGDVMLADFLSRLEGQEPCHMNRHWRPQSALIPSKSLIDYVGRVERFDEDFGIVRDRLGIADATQHVVTEHATHARHRMGMIGRKEKALIDRIYGEDFARFGYEMTLPVGADAS